MPRAWFYAIYARCLCCWGARAPRWCCFMPRCFSSPLATRCRSTVHIRLPAAAIESKSAGAVRFRCAMPPMIFTRHFAAKDVTSMRRAVSFSSLYYWCRPCSCHLRWLYYMLSFHAALCYTVVAAGSYTDMLLMLFRARHILLTCRYSYRWCYVSWYWCSCLPICLLRALHCCCLMFAACRAMLLFDAFFAAADVTPPICCACHAICSCHWFPPWYRLLILLFAAHAAHVCYILTPPCLRPCAMLRYILFVDAERAMMLITPCSAHAAAAAATPRYLSRDIISMLWYAEVTIFLCRYRLCLRALWYIFAMPYATLFWRHTLLFSFERRLFYLMFIAAIARYAAIDVHYASYILPAMPDCRCYSAAYWYISRQLPPPSRVLCLLMLPPAFFAYLIHAILLPRFIDIMPLIFPDAIFLPPPAARYARILRVLQRRYHFFHDAAQRWLPLRYADAAWRVAIAWYYAPLFFFSMLLMRMKIFDMARAARYGDVMRFMLRHADAARGYAMFWYAYAPFWCYFSWYRLCFAPFDADKSLLAIYAVPLRFLRVRHVYYLFTRSMPPCAIVMICLSPCLMLAWGYATVAMPPCLLDMLNAERWALRITYADILLFVSFVASFVITIWFPCSLLPFFLLVVCCCCYYYYFAVAIVTIWFCSPIWYCLFRWFSYLHYYFAKMLMSCHTLSLLLADMFCPHYYLPLTICLCCLFFIFWAHYAMLFLFHDMPPLRCRYVARYVALLDIHELAASPYAHGAIRCYWAPAAWWRSCWWRLRAYAVFPPCCLSLAPPYAARRAYSRR